MFFEKRKLCILLLILGCIAMRSHNLTTPLYDAGFWRQTDTAAMARNFALEEMNILHPRIDWRGDTSGYVESEFPLYPYLIAILYKINGQVDETFGRVLSILFAVFTVLVLYFFVMRLFDAETAFWSATFYVLSPLAAYFTRTFMPESMMMFFYVLSLFAVYVWMRDDSKTAWVVAMAATPLALLIKLTSVFIFIPMFALFFIKYRFRLLTKWQIPVFLAVSVVLPALWYGHAYRLYLDTGLSFGILGNYSYNKFLMIETWLRGQYWESLAYRFFGLLLTPLGGSLLVLGLAFSFTREKIIARHYFLVYWLASIVAYILLVAEGNRLLEYYQIFLVPIAGIFIARVVLYLRDLVFDRTARLRQGFAPFIYFVILISSLVVIRNDFITENYTYNTWWFSQTAQAQLPPGSLYIAVDSEGDDNPYWYKKMKQRISRPSLLYYIHRKGWVLLPFELNEMSPYEFRKYIRKGARFIIIKKSVLDSFEGIGRLFREVKAENWHEDKFFKVLKLPAE